MIIDEHLIHQISDVSIHSTIMVIFLTCFFFLISIRIEKHVAQEQIDKISKLYTSDLVLTPELKAKIISSIKLEKEDDSIEKGNNNILVIGYIFTGVITIMCIVINIVLYNISTKLNIGKVIVNNLITIIFIAFIEFIFIYFIGKNVDMIKASEINNKIYNIFDSYISF